MTERLYYTDSYLREFQATVVETEDDGRRVYLDRTAFYPDSGGQPHDVGTIKGVPVVDVVDEGDRIAHITAGPVSADSVECRIDWPRRFDHMQQHSGQHLLSAVLAEMYQYPTVGFHLGAESSAIDIAGAALSESQMISAETRANQVVFENRAVAISFEDASSAAGLRKPSEREGMLRIISIDGLDRSACGGTHVRSTGEIGPVLLGRLDRAHGNLRVEFVCGMRAVRRARNDYDALSKLAKIFSASPYEAPELVAGQSRSLAAAEKELRKANLELAQIRGRELYQSTPPNAAGLRCVVERVQGGLPDELRAKAQAFTAGGKACFAAAANSDRPALLLAVSKDTGIHAGNTVKEAAAKLGGRGGGSAEMAQASVPSQTALDELLAALGPAIELPL